MLEICLVLFVIAILIGAAAPGLSSWLSEERLREPARKLELLARTARLEAMNRQRPCEVIIYPHTLSLAQESDTPSPSAFSLPDSVTILTKAWREAAFTNRPEVHWRFQPTGLCEPLSIQLQQGGSQIALRFDPLTAAVAEESYEFR